MNKMSETRKSWVQVWMPEVEVSVCEVGSGGLDKHRPGVEQMRAGGARVSSFGAPTTAHLGCKADLVECFDLFAASSLLLLHNCLLLSSRVAMGQGVLHISSWTIVHVPSQPPGPSAAGLGPSASAEHALGHGACWLNLYDAASSVFCFFSLIQYPRPLQWSWEVWTSHGCLWEKLLASVRSRSCLEGTVVLGFALALSLPIRTGRILHPSRAKVLILALGPLSGCAEGNGLLNSDGGKATGPWASTRHGGGLDPALWSCEIRAILQWNCSWSLDGLDSGLLSSGMFCQGWGSKYREWNVH